VRKGVKAHTTIEIFSAFFSLSLFYFFFFWKTLLFGRPIEAKDRLSIARLARSTLQPTNTKPSYRTNTKPSYVQAHQHPEAKIRMHIFLTEDVGGPQKSIGPFSSGCVSICAPFFLL
jgi:hypothetical protein